MIAQNYSSVMVRKLRSTAVNDGPHRFRVFIARSISSTGENIQNVTKRRRDEAHQLDDGFGGDRQHQPMLMLGGVGLAVPNSTATPPSPA